MLSKQQVFDKVAEHLLTQREKAVRPNGDCAYRSPDGLKCAVGCLIPDDRYTPDLEGQGADWVPVLDALDGITNDRALLVSLQGIHDFHSPELWAEGLRWVADDYGLSTAVLAKPQPEE